MELLLIVLGVGLLTTMLSAADRLERQRAKPKRKPILYEAATRQQRRYLLLERVTDALLADEAHTAYALAREGECWNSDDEKDALCARCALYASDTDAARVHARRMLERAPHSQAGHALMALAFTQDDQADAAQTHLPSPLTADALTRLAAAHTAWLLQQPDRTLRHAAFVLHKTGSPRTEADLRLCWDARLLHAMAALDSGRMNDALDDARWLCGTRRWPALAYAVLALAHDAIGNDDALADALRQLPAVPLHGTAQVTLSRHHVARLDALRWQYRAHITPPR